MVKVMKFFLNFLLVLLFASADAMAQDYQVTVNKANVRNKPSMKSTVIGTLSKDARIKADEVLDGFIRFDFSGRTGYISHRVVEPVDAPVGENSQKSQPQGKDAAATSIEDVKDDAVSQAQKEDKSEKKKKDSKGKKEKKLKKVKVKYEAFPDGMIMWIKDSYKLKKCLENYYGSIKNQTINVGSLICYDPKTDDFTYAPFVEVFSYSFSGNEYVPEGDELLIRTGNDKVYVAKTWSAYGAGAPTYSANYSPNTYQVTGVSKSYDNIYARYFIPESAMADICEYGVKKVKLKDASGDVKTFELTDKQFDDLAYKIKCWIYSVRENVAENKAIYIWKMTPAPEKPFNEGF